jgi:hypothetical protein
MHILKFPTKSAQQQQQQQLRSWTPNTKSRQHPGSCQQKSSASDTVLLFTASTASSQLATFRVFARNNEFMFCHLCRHLDWCCHRLPNLSAAEVQGPLHSPPGGESALVVPTTPPCTQPDNWGCNSCFMTMSPRLPLGKLGSFQRYCIVCMQQQEFGNRHVAASMVAAYVWVSRELLTLSIVECQSWPVIVCGGGAGWG